MNSLTKPDSVSTFCDCRAVTAVKAPKLELDEVVWAGFMGRGCSSGFNLAHGALWMRR